MTNIKKIKDIPLSLNGVLLATLALSGIITYLLDKVDPNSEAIRWSIVGFLLVTLFLATFYVILISTKIIGFPNQTKKDFLNPKLSGLIGIFLIALNSFGNVVCNLINHLNLANQTALYLCILPVSISLLALILQIVYTLCFFIKIVTKHRLFKKETEAYGSFLIPFVGFGIGGCYCVNFHFLIPVLIYQIVWLFAIVSFFSFGIYSMFKIVIKGNQDKNLLTSQAIVASPTNVVGSAFLICFNPDNTKYLTNPLFFKIFSSILLTIGIITIIFYFVVWYRLSKNQVNKLTLASFGFPLAIFINHLLLFNFTFIYPEAKLFVLFIILLVLEIALTLFLIGIVIYLNYIHIRYINHLFKDNKDALENNYTINKYKVINN
ncbi:hypothetical protein [[Mycoplasma] anseris]|uniref:Uncharacterized protein n=1 Tax=[Mycoplasma] anseris TaxID=92400 RepID=A0A2Z4NCG3_9BACT|nr:hypothetical protein [[Mycoplasma] anseris]AWX69249.1 hypothetical protein DP065_00550 [[Mycoplasma] anseris]